MSVPPARHAGRGTAAVRNQAERTLNQWPLLVVLVGLLAAMGILTTGHWRRGSFAVGCTVVLAGVLRALLPTRVAGLLAVRSRLVDTLMLVVVGVGMLALTMVVPHTRPGY